MNLGIYVNHNLPTSKKQIKDAFAADSNSVTAYSTSSFDPNFFNDTLDKLPNGTHYFVGPDPHTSRKFYGQIIKSDAKITIK